METTNPIVQPLERIALDITRPLLDTERGSCFTMVVIDYFTKHVECNPMLDQRAHTVRKHLVYGFVSRYGVLKDLHSDQRRNFESLVFKSMCDRLGMTKTRTSPCNLEYDGMVERFMRIMGDVLSKYHVWVCCQKSMCLE